MADPTHASSLFKDSQLLLTTQGNEKKKKKVLIKGGHYTSEDILSITSHYRQPTAAKMLPCKSKNAPAQRCAATRLA